MCLIENIKEFIINYLNFANKKLAIFIILLAKKNISNSLVYISAGKI